MGNNTTPSPTTAPAEAPEIKSIQELQAKKADILVYLKSIPNLSDDEKQKLEEKYTQAVELLNGKTELEKKRILTGIPDDLKKLLNNIKNEKEDSNETDDTIETDETTTPAEQKLNVENEAKAHIEEFRASIETKLAAPATPETPPSASPEPAEVVPPETQEAINKSKEFFANKGVKLDTVAPVQWNWFQNILNKILLSWYGMLEGFGVDMRGPKARAEWYQSYESKQVVEETFKVLSGYMGDSVWEITNIADKEALVAKIEWLGLPLVAGSNILAGPLMKFIFTGEKDAWGELPNDMDRDTLRAVRGKYLTLRDNPWSITSITTTEKLSQIFNIEEGKKEGYITRYKEEKNKQAEENQIAPAVATTETAETTETTPEATASLTQILTRYDGKPYEEGNETPTKDNIFTFEQDDIFVAIKRWDQKETININADGKLTYRGITGTPEMIIQLARFDMYMHSLPGKLILSNPDNLSENSIDRIYPNIDGLWDAAIIAPLSAPGAAVKEGYDWYNGTPPGHVRKKIISTIPKFLAGWDWQKLYNFLLRDDARQIAPAEAAEMSGEKPKSITQEDLDILMQRTDVRETAEDAKFSGKIEEDSSITITRATEDGENKWDETIFPNADGTYTIGNVRFPNITDAVKAANMRNWVRWHDDQGHELHAEDSSIQVNDGTFNDTDLIKDWKIPEFLTHGVLPDTENPLTSFTDVYDFLKGAVIEDGIYGKNTTRAKWEEYK